MTATAATAVFSRLGSPAATSPDGPGPGAAGPPEEAEEEVMENAFADVEEDAGGVEAAGLGDDDGVDEAGDERGDEDIAPASEQGPGVDTSPAPPAATPETAGPERR